MTKTTKTAKKVKSKARKAKTTKKVAKVKKVTKRTAAKAEGNKSAQIVALAQRAEGVTNTQLKEITGWKRLGGFFGAVKRAGLKLERRREDGDTRWFAKAA